MNRSIKFLFSLFFVSLFFILGIYVGILLKSEFHSKLWKENTTGVLTSFWKNTVESNNFFPIKVWETTISGKLFLEAMEKVNAHYYFSWTLTPEEIERWMIVWVLNALGDKFSEYFTPKEKKEFEENLQWDFEWIGAVVEKNALGVQISQLLKGSPALKNWLQKGDIIMEANGVKLQNMSVTEAVSHIRGPAGTTVKLKIFRQGEKDFLYKEILREKIKIPSVEEKDIGEKGIGYISLNMFWQHTSRDFEEILKKYEKDTSIKGIIIDLRDNGWGYLHSAVEILSLFIENGKVLVTTKYRNKNEDDAFYSSNWGNIFSKKVVILINENSASASEIVAWAMKDYKKAIIVGKKSYGKGSVQETFDLSDESMLKLTIAKWYTPWWSCIDLLWIQPDIEIGFDSKKYREEGKDSQLEWALSILKKYIEWKEREKVIEYFKENSLSWTTYSWAMQIFEEEMKRKEQK